MEDSEHRVCDAKTMVVVHGLPVNAVDGAAAMTTEGIVVGAGVAKVAPPNPRSSRIRPSSHLSYNCIRNSFRRSFVPFESTCRGRTCSA